MQVHESQMVELLVELGVTTAPDWTATPGKVAAKVNNAEGGITKYAPSSPLKEARLQNLYDEVAAHQGAGGTVDVLPGAATPAPSAAPKKKAKKKAGGSAAAAPKKAAPKKAAPKKVRQVTSTIGTTTVTTTTKAKPRYGRPAADAPWAEQQKWYAKNPIAITGRGPGVMRTVVDQLRAAGRGAKPKPISKAHLLGVLKAAFPDRDPLKMETNLSNILPGRLKRIYGIHVWKAKLQDGTAGYYIHKDGKEPQPKAGRGR